MSGNGLNATRDLCARIEISLGEDLAAGVPTRYSAHDDDGDKEMQRSPVLCTQLQRNQAAPGSTSLDDRPAPGWVPRSIDAHTALNQSPDAGAPKRTGYLDPAHEPDVITENHLELLDMTAGESRRKTVDRVLRSRSVLLAQITEDETADEAVLGLCGNAMSPGAGSPGRRLELWQAMASPKESGRGSGSPKDSARARASSKESARGRGSPKDSARARASPKESARGSGSPKDSARESCSRVTSSKNNAQEDTPDAMVPTPRLLENLQEETEQNARARLRASRGCSVDSMADVGLSCHDCAHDLPVSFQFHSGTSITKFADDDTAGDGQPTKQTDARSLSERSLSGEKESWRSKISRALKSSLSEPNYQIVMAVLQW